MKTTTTIVDTSTSGGYIASVQLLVPDGSDGSYCIAQTAQGKESCDQQEIINSVIHSAIGFLTDKYGLVIMDPSFSTCRDLEHLEQAVQAELDMIHGSARWFSHENLHDIHKLAAKYDGSVCVIKMQIYIAS